MVQRPRLPSVTLSSPPTVARLWLGRHECFNADSVHSWWAGGFILAAAAVVWLYLPRPDKVGIAAQAIVALVIMVVLIKAAGAIYTDPQPSLSWIRRSSTCSPTC